MELTHIHPGLPVCPGKDALSYLSVSNVPPPVVSFSSLSSQFLYMSTPFPLFLLFLLIVFPPLPSSHFSSSGVCQGMEPGASHILGKNSGTSPSSHPAFPLLPHLLSLISIFPFSFSSLLLRLPFSFLFSLSPTLGPFSLCPSFLLSLPALLLCSCPRRPLADPPLLPWLPSWFQRALRSPGEP